jgi:hypothetical protein
MITGHVPAVRLPAGSERLAAWSRLRLLDAKLGLSL